MSTTEGSGGSVLRRLSSRGRQVPRLLLRDDADDATKVVRPRPAESAASSAGRYQVLGEIARGGVGVVMRGHDVDLGRDVAIKVLRDEYATNEDVLARFVEEAQIGGQLQHPGIVPVYDLGLRAEGKPYFAMKLIKGRTLGAMLAERKKVTDGRRRLVAIFASTCRTMAYAHARGVVHRDLKPANVMVGAFGEVLVVDWGLGKVLGSEPGVASQTTHGVSRIETLRTGSTGSQSLVGSIIGTPRYMPPEQARGETDKIDATSDVFSLGAILCEILTGAPPYDVKDEADAVRRAARAELEPAMERLTRCGAEPALIKIAKACLAPAQSARPPHGGAIADEVEACLAAGEDRARKAREAAAAAEVEIEEQRRRRKIILGFGGLAVAAVLVAVTAFAWVDSSERKRQADLAARIDDALADVAQARGGAEGAALDDVAAWDKLAKALEPAQGLVADGMAGAEAKARVDEIAAAAKKGRDLAAAALAKKKLEESTIDRVVGLLAVAPGEPATSASAAAAVLRDFGLDVSTSGAEDVVKGSRISESLITALDVWRGAKDVAADVRAKIDAVLLRADPDEFRRKVRASNLEALVALADADDVRKRSPLGLVLLAERLGTLGDVERAVDVARTATSLAPDNVFAACELGRWSPRLPDPVWNGAIEGFMAVLALRPDAGAAWERLAEARTKTGDAEGGTRVAAEWARRAASAR